MTRTHAAILCRVSTEGQRENTSLADQRRILTEMCDRQGWTWEAFDEVESGGAGIANRPVLAQILGRIAAGEFQRLVVLHLDRASRAGVGELEELSQVLARVGARLVTQMGEYDPRNLDHGLMLDMQGVMAKNERLRIRERTIRGRESVIRDGGFAGHPTPYGWRRVWEPDGSSRFEVVPDEAAAVREIYARYLTGIEGIKSLCAAYGLTYARVSGILSSPRYAGIERFRGSRSARWTSGRDSITVPSRVWPAIVSVEEWQAAAAMRNRKVTHDGAGGGPAKHPLSGILRCQGCGARMYYVLNHGVTPSYQCRTKTCPDRQFFRADDAHRAVLGRLPELVAYWDAYQESQTDDPGEERRRVLRVKLATIDADEVELFRQRSRGVISDDQFGRLNRLLMDDRAAAAAELTAIDKQRRQAAGPIIRLGEAAAVVADDAATLDDGPFLRMVFAGMLAEARLDRSAKGGRNHRPTLTLQSATLVGGVAWSAIKRRGT